MGTIRLVDALATAIAEVFDNAEIAVMSAVNEPASDTASGFLACS